MVNFFFQINFSNLAQFGWIYSGPQNIYWALEPQLCTRHQTIAVDVPSSVNLAHLWVLCSHLPPEAPESATSLPENSIHDYQSFLIPWVGHLKLPGFSYPRESLIQWGKGVSSKYSSFHIILNPQQDWALLPTNSNIFMNPLLNFLLPCITFLTFPCGSWHNLSGTKSSSQCLIWNEQKVRFFKDE